MKLTNNFAFFWKGPLGQWNKTPFTDNRGITYNCAEQYMMAKKALLFGDLETYQLIMNSTSPKEQQDYGRIVKGFNQTVWDANAATIVYQGNFYKFSQNANLLELLLSTGDRIMVEASPFDLVWGIGYAEEDDEEIICDISKWKGKNLLGWTLTNLKNDYFRK